MEGVTEEREDSVTNRLQIVESQLVALQKAVDELKCSVDALKPKKRSAEYRALKSRQMKEYHSRIRKASEQSQKEDTTPATKPNTNSALLQPPGRYQATYDWPSFR
jgi:DNA-binding FrmR family transcriptional regulator